ncbi:MAG: MlaE family ABC transporter permease [Nitrospinota bacterium]
MSKIIEFIGSLVLATLRDLGRFTLFSIEVIKWLFYPPFKIRDLIGHMSEIGVNSLVVVSLTAFATGSVLALQTYQGFARFGAESMVGAVVGLSMVRELGPMLTAIMVAARAGSAMAAELGSMKVTEQIDALYTLSANPIKYLIVPRFIATTVTLPFLVVLANVIGIGGGALVSVHVLGANPVTYFERTFTYLTLNDIYSGLIKSVVFGMTIALISCYQGFDTEGGAEGVGLATTRAVVMSSISIFIFDYILTAILFDNL